MRAVPSEDDAERCVSAKIFKKGFHFARIFTQKDSGQYAVADRRQCLHDSHGWSMAADTRKKVFQKFPTVVSKKLEFGH